MAPAGRVAAVNGLAAAASMDAMVSIARKGVRRLFMLLIYGSLTMRGKMMLSRPDIHDNIAIYSPRFFFGSGKLVAVVIGNPDFGSGVDWNFYRSEEHTSELQSLMRISYAVFCLKKKISHNIQIPH